MRILTILILFASGVLAGCGGGGGSAPAPVQTSSTPEETGQLVISLTDAEGDFLSYTVDVTSVALERADGTRVETLPLTTRVDFAELVEVTELLTIATVPAGRYRSVTLGLDFADAEVIVQDDAGNLQQATLVDEAGAPLGELAVALQLTDADAVVIRPGIPAAFSLDFDLDASNSIDAGVSPPVVTVMPFLLATPELEADRSHRVRGMLAAVDEAAETFTLAVRPFRHRTGDFGRLTLDVNGETLYEIDGVGYEGPEGLAALAALTGSDERVPVVASGMPSQGSIAAQTVLAGSSVPWTSYDVALGAVVARSGDVLTLSGVLLEYADGVVARRGRVDVLLGDGTSVTALGLDNDTLDKDSISVGQRVLAFGQVTDDGTLAATEGHVRMLISHLTADVVATGDLALDLYFLNGRRPVVYDFSGTGTDPANDADPDYYQVDTATLPLSQVEVGDLVRVRGHVNRFGMAPADFLALTVIDVSLDQRSAAFGAVWPEPTATPTVSIDPASIVLDLAEARSELHLRGVPHGAGNPLETLALVAPDDGRGVYAVRVRGAGQIHLYRNFADFSDQVLDQLQAGNLLARVGAIGRYNADGNELTTGRATFLFVEPGQ